MDFKVESELSLPLRITDNSQTWRGAKW